MDTKDMDCIILVQDREECRDVVNTITKNAGELPDYYASFRALTAVFQTIRVVWNLTPRPQRFENTCQLHSQVLRSQTPNLARLSYFHVQQLADIGPFSSGQPQSLLTHCGRVTQICVFTLQLCRTGDADLRF